MRYSKQIMVRISIDQKKKLEKIVKKEKKTIGEVVRELIDSYITNNIK